MSAGRRSGRWVDTTLSAAARWEITGAFVQDL